MSGIVQNAARVAAAKTSLKTAINARGGTLTTEKIDSYAAAVTALPSGTDVSDTTATNHDVLTGKYFYTAAGGKAEGTITVVSAQPDPAVSVNASTGVVTANYTALSGFCEDNTTHSATLQLTVQPAQTITPGTANQIITAGKFLTGEQTILGDANLTAANIAKNVTIFGITGTHESGTDVSDTTATAADVASGKIFHIADGNTETGSLSIDAGKILYGQSIGSVSGTATKFDSAYPGDILNGRQAHARGESITGTIPLKGGTYYTPGTTNQVIAAGVYLSGDQTILGDADLVAGNIKKNVNIFGVVGTYEGASSVVDIIKVTQYTPYSPSRTDVTSIVVSGIGTVAETDRSAMNGTYNVTAATAAKTGTARVYKHATQNYYLAFYDNGWDESHDWYACFDTSASPSYWGCILSKSGDTLSSGTATWYNSDYGDSVSVTLAVTETTTPAVAQVLKGVKATAYDATAKVWTFGSTEYDFSTFDNTPTVNYMWAGKGTSLIGKYIDFATIVTKGLVFYAPLVDNYTTITGQTLTLNGSGISFGIIGGRPCATLNGSTYLSFTPTGLPTSTFSLCANVYIDNTSSSYQHIFGYGTDSQFGVAILAIDGMTVAVERGSGHIMSSGTITAGVWHHLAAVSDGSTLTIYLDGVSCYSASHSFSLSTSEGAIGAWLSGSSKITGSINSCRVYNRVLSQAEILQLANEF